MFNHGGMSSARQPHTDVDFMFRSALITDGWEINGSVPTPKECFKTKQFNAMGKTQNKMVDSRFFKQIC